MGLVKAGTGTLTLAGNNAQTGGLTVSNGLLTLNAAQSYGGATIISAGTLNVNSAPASLPTISGLAYHLDASNAANLNNGGGVTDGGAVTQWADISGNGNNFTAGATAPTYAASGINGLGAVSFDGPGSGVVAGDRSTWASLVSSAPATLQTVFVVNQTTWTYLGGMWSESNGAAGLREDLVPNQWRTTNVPDGDFGPYTINGVPANPAYFTNGVPQVTESVSAGPENWATMLGYGQNNYYNGYVGEVAVYSGLLTAGQQAAVNEYLEAKWLGVGVPGGNFLPSTSPVSLTAVGATLNIGYDQTIPSLSGVPGSTVNQEAGTLTVGGDNSSTTFAGSLNGGGAFVKNGGGVFTLSGSNSFSGGATVNAGTLQIGAGGSGEALASPVSLANGATLAFNHADSLTYASPISGNGQLLKTGGGALTLVGSQSYSGATTVANGTLRLAAVPIANGNFALPALAPGTSDSYNGNDGLPYGWPTPPANFGWTVEGDIHLYNGATWSGGTTPPNGGQACFLQGDNPPASISQTISFPAAGVYSLAWSAEGQNTGGEVVEPDRSPLGRQPGGYYHPARGGVDQLHHLADRRHGRDPHRRIAGDRHGD